MGGATIVSASSAALTSSSPSTGPAMTSQASAMAAAAQKERKASFYQHNSISSSSIYGDDEINDVAAMGGVNLAEESQRILGSTELIGTQIRSCKDEVFLHLPALQSKIRAIVARHGLEEASADVAVLVSHAAQERLKNIVEKLAVIAEHRVDVIKVSRRRSYSKQAHDLMRREISVSQLDPRYEVTKDVRGQVKFLEELDKAEQKRHDEQEREMLLRAAKSRTKNEDPEQAKLKAKVSGGLVILLRERETDTRCFLQAKEMQRAEMEELRQRDANLTALQAIGMRKKPRLDGDAATTGTTVSDRIIIMSDQTLIVCPVISERDERQWVRQRILVDAAAAALEESELEGHDLLPRAGTGNVSEFDAVPRLSQVIVALRGGKGNAGGRGRRRRDSRLRRGCCYYNTSF